MRSTIPCTSKNSLRWKPGGRRWRIVCSMTREPDERAGLGEVQVSEKREARGDAAGRRVSQNADVREAGVLEPFECGDGLGHLHEAQDPLLHPRAAAGLQE